MYKSRARKAKSAAADFVKRATSASIYTDTSSKPKKESPQKANNTKKDKNTSCLKEEKKSPVKLKQQAIATGKEKKEQKNKKVLNQPATSELSIRKEKASCVKETAAKKRQEKKVSKDSSNKGNKLREENKSPRKISNSGCSSVVVVVKQEATSALETIAQNVCVPSASCHGENVETPNGKDSVVTCSMGIEHDDLFTQLQDKSSSDTVSVKQEPVSPQSVDISHEKDFLSSAAEIYPVETCSEFAAGVGTLDADNPPVYDTHPSLQVTRDHFLTLLGLVKASDFMKGKERQGPSHGLHRMFGGKLRRRVPRKSPDGVQRVLSLSRGCVMPKYCNRSDSDGDSPHVKNKTSILHVDQDRQKSLSPKVQHKFKTFCAQKTPVISIQKLKCKGTKTQDSESSVSSLSKSSSFKENEPDHQMSKTFMSQEKLSSHSKTGKIKLIQKRKMYPADIGLNPDVEADAMPERQSLRQKIKYRSVVPVWKRKQVIDFNQFRITKKDIKEKEKKEKERRRRKEEEESRLLQNEKSEMETKKEATENVKLEETEKSVQEIKKKMVIKPKEAILTKQPIITKKPSHTTISIKTLKKIEKEEDLLCYESFPEEVDDEHNYQNEDRILALFPHTETRSVPTILRKSRSLPHMSGDGAVVDTISCWKYSAANVTSTNDILLSPRKARRKNPIMPKLDPADIPMDYNSDAPRSPPKLEKEVDTINDHRDSSLECNEDMHSIDLNCHESGLQMCLDLDGAEEVDYIEEVIIDDGSKDSNSRGKMSVLSDHCDEGLGREEVLPNKDRDTAVSGLLELSSESQMEEHDSQNVSSYSESNAKVDNYSFKDYECVIPHMCQVCWINDHMYCKNMKRVARDLPPCGGCLHYIPCSHYKMIQDNSNYSHRWGQNGKFAPQNIKVDEKNNLTLEPTSQGLIGERIVTKLLKEEEDDKSIPVEKVIAKWPRKKKKAKYTNIKLETCDIMDHEYSEYLDVDTNLKDEPENETVHENTEQDMDSSIPVLSSQTVVCSDQISQIDLHEYADDDSKEICEISPQDNKEMKELPSHDTVTALDEKLCTVTEHECIIPVLMKELVHEITEDSDSGKCENSNPVFEKSEQCVDLLDVLNENEQKETDACVVDKNNSELSEVVSIEHSQAKHTDPVRLQVVDCESLKGHIAHDHQTYSHEHTTEAQDIQSESISSSTNDTSPNLPITEHEKCVDTLKPSEQEDTVLLNPERKKTNKKMRKRDQKLKSISSLHSLFIRVLPASSVNAAALKGQNTGNRSKVIAIKVQHSQRRSDHIARAERGSVDGEVLVTVPIKPKTAKRIKEIAYMGSPEMSSLLQHMHIAVIAALSKHDADLSKLDLVRLTKEVDTLSRSSSKSKLSSKDQKGPDHVSESTGKTDGKTDNVSNKDSNDLCDLKDIDGKLVVRSGSPDKDGSSREDSESMEMKSADITEEGIKFSIPARTTSLNTTTEVVFTARDIALQDSVILNYLKSQHELVDILRGKLATETSVLDLKMKEIKKECDDEDLLLQSQRAELSVLLRNKKELQSCIDQQRAQSKSIDDPLSKLTSKRCKLQEEKTHIMKKLKLCHDSMHEMKHCNLLE